MNKAIQHKGNISSITAKVDGSIAYRINTPQLSNEEKSAVFDLQNKNIEILINPLGEEEAQVIKINKDLNQKTPSERLRGVLWHLWQRNNEGHSVFDTYYTSKMEGFIEHLKEKLDE